MAGPEYTADDRRQEQKKQQPESHDNPKQDEPRDNKRSRANHVVVSGNITLNQEKNGVGEKVANNPALIGGIASAIITALVAMGLDPELSSQLEDLIVFALITLGVGGTAGAAVRQSVTPVRKLKKNRLQSEEDGV